MSTLEQDVKTLQSQVRRQRRWNIALGAVVVVGGLMAATGVRSVPDVIQAKKFEVVNDEGKVIVSLQNLQGGGVDNGMIETRISTGGVLAQIAAGPGGGVVTTQNGKGGTLVELGATTGGNGLVKTQNGKGGTLVEIFSDSVGGCVRTANISGQVVTFVGAESGGSGVLVTLDGGEITSKTPSP